MNVAPNGFDVSALGELLAEQWGFRPVQLNYLAVGFGSHHWLATDLSGDRRFVTVDELGPVAPDDGDATLEGLEKAFRIAHVLRHKSQLGFVLAPLLAASGRCSVGLDHRFAVTVFPFTEGTSAAFGKYESDAERTAVVNLLIALHDATPDVQLIAARDEFSIPYRRDLEKALQELTTDWMGGPFANPARDLLLAGEQHVRRLLENYDHLVDDVRDAPNPWVITHGEPHAANILTTREGLMLIDWDTALLAPAERDLWMVTSDGPSELDDYRTARGHEVDEKALVLYRLRWELVDIAISISIFRDEHELNADTQTSFDALARYLVPVSSTG